MPESSPNVLVIIPAFNEEDSVAKVVKAIPADIVKEVVVVNNNSTDNTPERAAASGATVLDEPKKGYGSACLRGIAYAKAKTPAERPDTIVFLDADYSDYPEEMRALTSPIFNNTADLVIGSRVLGKSQKGALLPQQIFGNKLATGLLRLFYRVRFTDLGPFRAIRFDKLLSLDMQDKTYGWTVEMQLKAAKQKLRCTEVPVSYRPRIGRSKISGTLKGSLLAGYKILWTIFRYL